MLYGLEVCGAALLGIFRESVSVVGSPAVIKMGLNGVTEHCPESDVASQLALTEPP